MDKEFLIECLNQGLSTRDIETLPNVNIKRSTISYYIRKHGLIDLAKYKKVTYNNQGYFEMIDTKEKAYIVGYTLADGYIADNTIEYGCALTDREILDFIASELGANVREDRYFDKKARRFPRARISVGNKGLIKDINKFGRGENKTFPRISKDLEHYMLLGFFDGDGCLTYGYRKDRNRLWQKVSFTGSYKLLFAIQKLLSKLEITSSLYPKTNENCFVLELSSKKDVKKILEYIYGSEDLIVLHRKYNKYRALRLEWDEFGGTIDNDTIPSQAADHSAEGVETSGEKTGSLNNHNKLPSL